MSKIDKLFRVLLDKGASDLHLLQGQPPKLRLHGHLEAMPGAPPLTEEALLQLLEEICPPTTWSNYQATGDADFAYAMGEEARFRANYYKGVTGIGAVFRIIPVKILTLDTLKAPEIFKEFVSYKMGLVLVTGPTGSGKSTTLAAILDHLNTNFSRRVLTIEDPVEFVHKDKQSTFIQREVGSDTISFSTALRAAGREDCDVILVGEMRDLETISLAISAAETGALVFGTLHTNSAAKTIDRIVNVFPADQQRSVRNLLAGSLKAVVSQQLLRTADGQGRVAVHEILLQNAAAGAAIREGHIAKLNQVIQSGRKMGMQSMDDALLKLVEAGTVEAEAAYMKANDKKMFKHLLKGKAG